MSRRRNAPCERRTHNNWANAEKKARKMEIRCVRHSTIHACKPSDYVALMRGMRAEIMVGSVAAIVTARTSAAR